MIDDSFVERDASVSGLGLDDSRRSIPFGAITVDRTCRKTVSQFLEQLFCPLGVGNVTAERRPRRDTVFEFAVRRA